MEKFSLFDLLAFAIPGSMALFLTYWGLGHITPIRLDVVPISDTLLVIIMGMLAYLAGHLVNELAMWLERRLGGLPKSWVTILTNNADLAQKLNTISQKTFQITFLGTEGQVLPAESGLFYDYAFNTLETSGKLEKVRILQSQYTFLRNTVALCVWAIFILLTVLIVQLSNGQPWDATIPLLCYVSLIGCLVLAWQTRRMSFKRRHFKMSATLHAFYALYVLENQFKQ